ncbi:MAG: peptidyl-prolyl cis-trans isomerase [Polyangia bacterium]
MAIAGTDCKKNRGKTGGASAEAAQNGKSTGKSTGDSSGDSRPVARIDDTVITVGDVQDRINKMAPFPRGRYVSLEKKKDMLDNLIRIEVMAKEAEKRGYDQDPEVIRVKKQQMISKFLQKEFESKLRVEDVPDADVQKYYGEHPEEFNRPDEVRVSQILLADKAKADKVAAEARAADKSNPKTFTELVAKYSQDEDSKARGGDLTSFDKGSTIYPKPVIEAAFSLKEVGEVSAPVKSDKGFHVLRLTQKRPGFSRPLPEVKRQIQQRLFREMRTKALDAFVADLKKKYAVTVDEGNLAQVTVDTSADMRATAPGAPGGPGAGFHPGIGAPIGAVPGTPGFPPVFSPPPAPGMVQHSGPTGPAPAAATSEHRVP